jgi:hypothetical protein
MADGIGAANGKGDAAPPAAERNSVSDGLPWLFRGTVRHARAGLRRNVFSYPVFFIRFPVSRLDALVRPWFSLDRFNVFSLHRKDHGPRDGSDLQPWIRHLLVREGCGFADGEVWLQTFPRILGYVFNPVSFWLCHDRAGQLRTVLCEVSNTFGERHLYLLHHPDARPIAPADWLGARKVFHVSPFFPVRGGYRFRFDTGSLLTSIHIDYEDDAGNRLATSVAGSGKPLTSQELLRCFLYYPWMTMLVTLRIHWQAIRLWRKGVPFFRKPAPPAQELSR